MGSRSYTASQQRPFKVLILGGSYAGLSAALDLIDLTEGRAARRGENDVPTHGGNIPVDITIVDERDGYCMLLRDPLRTPSVTIGAFGWMRIVRDRVSQGLLAGSP